MRDPLFLLGAKEGVEKVRRGGISAVEWTSSCIERIDQLEPAVHAWSYFERQAVFWQAQTLDSRLTHARNSGTLSNLGALLGVPVGIKDVFNTADMPTCMGSPIWEGFTPGNDARVVFYLRQANAIIAGKTVTAEFAVHAPGKTTNPHHPAYSPGTSSSGSAAAVACFMVPLAIGTQTAGSVMRPASYCGVYGFKPTFGLIPRTGTLKTTDSLDTIGMFARNTEDLELLFETIRVRGEDYPFAHAFLDDPNTRERKNKHWKVGLVASSLWVWGKAAPYAQTALREFGDSLAEQGIEVEEVRLPSDFNAAHDIHSTIYDKTLSYYFKEEFKQRTLVSEIMYRIISHGQTISLEEYQLALEKQNRLSRLLDRIFKDYDVLLTLTTAGQAPKGGQDDIPDSCLLWTLCGVPVINLPLFKSPEDLPFGAQIVARRYHDPRLLNFSRHLENLFPKSTRVLYRDREVLIS